ncbi:MAG: nodulation protein NfeD [Bacteroidetes bacterium]|nr:MAG: nodulation protein NfeD [Bacteroidota bacterium]
MGKKILFLLVIILMGASYSYSSREDRITRLIEENPGKEFLIFKFDIKEQIAAPALRRTQRAFEDADTLGADVILIHMNTYGGQVDIADSIRTRIMQSKIPVMVFIDNNAASAGALISIATDRIYMRPGANIGAATVVDQTGEVVPDKFQSYMRSMMRSTAEAKDRDPDIAQAMVDPSIEIEGVIDEGKVLTFTSSEAMRWGFCEGMAESIDEVIKLAGFENFTVVEQKLTGMDRVINFLIHPIVSGLLIMLILGGIYFELQTPGVGFPILLAASAALLYFSPLYIEGLASHWEIIIFVLGIVLVAVEIFALPGFGVAGITGIIFMVSGLALAMVGNQGPDFTGVPMSEIGQAFLIVIIAFFLSLSSSFYIGAKLITSHGRLGNTLSLNTIQDTSAGYSSVNIKMRDLLGKTGVTYTMLRPSGKVEVDDDVYDATALTGYIDKGETVKIVKYETSQVFVVKVQKEQS